ncbi:uncharacterized protein LOC127718308 [Mytilus californianus]|uniref:uncharacterized protein LOC127718308 n=1 Tax=Mytilus californianus TaxID=6549 RepID=UPI0022471304|nr:uncharacterized protein LOC127718308 [Mytilus californianus]
MIVTVQSFLHDKNNMKRCGIRTIFFIFLTVSFVYSNSQTTESPYAKPTTQSTIHLIDRELTKCCPDCHQVNFKECKDKYNGAGSYGLTECAVNCPSWHQLERCSVRCTGSQLEHNETEDDCECVYTYEREIYDTVNNDGAHPRSVFFYCIFVSFATLMIWLIELVFKVKARLRAGRPRSICVENGGKTRMLPNILRMQTEVLETRQQSLENQRDNYCEPWEITSYV